MSKLKVTITNYTDLKEQFDNLGGNYKTARQIAEDLTKEVNAKVMEHDGISIPCERDNFDSADCLFSLEAHIDDTLVFEYTGTAK